YFCAFDATGNLYVDGSDSNGEFVIGEIANATTGGTKLTTLTVGNSIVFPGGLQVTTTGDIALDDQSGFAVYTYKPPVGGKLGMPVSTTPLGSASDPVTYAFTSTMGDLYTADAGLAESQEYSYPAGALGQTISVPGGEPIGVAIIPTQFPQVGK
ncbi:MAG: hypothetical protein IAI50_15750, partial [Candidatus Eremiobacteraeota bacterium]|nr:hypothetical protein [Candidatus Eremiobacteraeota bacterium]